MHLLCGLAALWTWIQKASLNICSFLLISSLSDFFSTVDRNIARACLMFCLPGLLRSSIRAWENRHGTRSTLRCVKLISRRWYRRVLTGKIVPWAHFSLDHWCLENAERRKMVSWTIWVQLSVESWIKMGQRAFDGLAVYKGCFFLELSLPPPYGLQTTRQARELRAVSCGSSKDPYGIWGSEDTRHPDLHSQFWKVLRFVHQRLWIPKLM